jgi:hypothetical protein
MLACLYTCFLNALLNGVMYLLLWVVACIFCYLAYLLHLASVCLLFMLCSCSAFKLLLAERAKCKIILNIAWLLASLQFFQIQF